MPDTPTFGRYAEIPYEQMTPEQQEAYRSLIETTRGDTSSGNPPHFTGSHSLVGSPHRASSARERSPGLPPQRRRGFASWILNPSHCSHHIFPSTSRFR